MSSSGPVGKSQEEWRAVPWPEQFQILRPKGTEDGKVHPLAFIHHTSTYQASLCKLIDVSPAINVLQDRLKENEIRLTMLQEEAKILEDEAFNRGCESSLASPQRVQAHHGSRCSLMFGQTDSHALQDSTSLSPASVAEAKNLPERCFLNIYNQIEGNLKQKR